MLILAGKEFAFGLIAPIVACLYMFVESFLGDSFCELFTISLES